MRKREIEMLALDRSLDFFRDDTGTVCSCRVCYRCSFYVTPDEASFRHYGVILSGATAESKNLSSNAIIRVLRKTMTAVKHDKKQTAPVS